MNSNNSDWVEVWYSASIKKVLLFALMWFGEGLLILWFVRRVMAGSGLLYFFAAFWTLSGLIVIVRPHWLKRMLQGWERNWERLGENIERRPPPGFP